MSSLSCEEEFSDGRCSAAFALSAKNLSNSEEIRSNIRGDNTFY